MPRDIGPAVFLKDDSVVMFVDDDDDDDDDDDFPVSSI